jgi:uncharacterized protein (TIGR03118 family)
LVSNHGLAAPIHDPRLVNPWGIALGPTDGDFWIADNGTSVATLYGGDVAGSPLDRNHLVSQIPGGSPTGAVFNATNDFVITGADGSSGPAALIFATQTGNIVGVLPPAPADDGQVAANVTGADFTGLAIGQDSSAHNLLFAADFANGKIDVFDGGFKLVSPAGSFADPNLPAGFAPFNIDDIGGKLYVTYAMQTGSGAFVPAATGGIVDIFDAAGNLIERYSSDSHLNAPWGIAPAPANFGQFSGDVLVGDFGDGRINAFKSDGTFDGQLTDTNGNPLSVAGLRGLSFGNGVSSGDSNSLFFTAQPGVPPAPTAVLLLDPSGQGALTAVGNGSVNVVGGGAVVVDSNNPAAVAAIGNAQLAASAFDVTGGTSILGNAHVSGNVANGVAAAGDPLATLAAPSMPTATFAGVQASGQMDVTLEPGTYTGGISVSGFATVTLQPGVYYLQGGGLSATGQGRILGDGVTIYLASPGTVGNGRGISVEGHGVIRLTAPSDDTDPFQGIAVFDARDNAASIAVGRNGALIVTGTIYAPAAAVDLSESGQLLVRDNPSDGVMAQVIVSDLQVIENADFDMRAAATIGAAAGQAGLFGVVNAAATTSPLAITSTDLLVLEGPTIVRDVAAFASTAAGASPADFTATIAWGDGTSSAGSVTAAPGGGFLVVGSHVYAEEGNDTVTVVISDNSGNTATASEKATVLDSPLKAHGVRIEGTTSANSTFVLANPLLATFVDAGGPGPAANYTATIDWGDGSTTTAGIALSSDGTTFDVTGSHTYTQSGRFTATVSIEDDGGTMATATTIVINGHTAADDNSAFVQGAFNNLLDRAADSGSLSAFNKAIANGMSPSTATQAITGSDEYLEGVIQQAYRDYLGRAAESMGLQFWLFQMRHGLTEAQMDAAFIASPEFFDHSGGSNAAWLTELYFDLLGRAPDAGSLAGLLNALSRGADHDTIALGFAASAERAALMIESDYQTFLGRGPSQAELNAWVAAYERGLTDQAIVAGFVGSPEFFQQQTADD